MLSLNRLLNVLADFIAIAIELPVQKEPTRTYAHINRSL